ncbi:LOW QUALITY PROTEIN: cytokine receptor common subunit gamma [Tachyglossus aculeatus]|uniref:LOW QUALITY PROTEIN: cytokine receptor common subunit gamma n=1 Tax=Tachyglossus aculeatus TaxID=9261 RepID=UPI0018F3CC7E|nr:LOW QUALITY PROTEIN: cytokine receptor common subunit gamma [Tachyglossus aculeatus]
MASPSWASLLPLLLFLLGGRASSRPPAPAVVSGGLLAPRPLPVRCVVFNVEYMTCTWNGSDRSWPRAANLTLRYWCGKGENRSRECGRYLVTEGLRSGCWFNRTEICLYETFGVQLWTPFGALPKQEGMRLQDLVVPWPPWNLTLWNVSDSQLELSWTDRYSSQCLEHQVQYQTDQDAEWTVQWVSQQQRFSLASADGHKRYTFRVRSRFSPYCGSAQAWSSWSDPVHWGVNSSREAPPTGTGGLAGVGAVLIPLAFLTVLLVLVTALVRLERVWIILMPQIPNLKHLDELVSAHRGNFSDWSGVSKGLEESLQPDYSEHLCHISEPPPPDL